MPVLNFATNISSDARLEFTTNLEEGLSDGGGSFTIGAVFVGIVSSSLISLLTGSSFEGTWLLLNTIQIFTLIPIIAIFIPHSYRLFCQQLVQIHGQFKIIPNLFEKLVTPNVSFEPVNEAFALMKFESTHFMLNSGSNLEIWATILVVSLLSATLYSFLKTQLRDFFLKILNKVDFALRYSFIIRSMCISYVYLAISAQVNLVHLNWKLDYGLLVLNSGGILGALLMIMLPIKVFDLLYRTFNRITSSLFTSRMKTLILDLNLTSTL